MGQQHQGIPAAYNNHDAYNGHEPQMGHRPLHSWTDGPRMVSAGGGVQTMCGF